jgi:hypothetical protein
MLSFAIVFAATVLASWLSPQLRSYSGAMVLVGLLFMVLAISGNSVANKPRVVESQIVKCEPAPPPVVPIQCSQQRYGQLENQSPRERLLKAD